MNNQYMERLNALAERLPFHLEDVEDVNGVFLRWHTLKEGDDLETLEIWLYCRTQWYVLNKLVRDTKATPNDFDQISSVVFTKVRKGMEAVRDPKRFVNWVNVVSRNAYLTVRKSERPRDELNEEMLADDTDPMLLDMDRAEILGTIKRAIDRLPASLSEVGRMRLLENMSHKQIAKNTGLPLASARTYSSRVLAKLREDPEIQDVARDIVPGLVSPVLHSKEESKQA